MANTTTRPKRSKTSASESQQPKYVYSFGDGKAEGSAHMRDVLGGKGANLAEMTSLGIPVPPGFTITTEVCDYYNKHSKQYPPELEGQIDEALRLLESRMGAKLGDDANPLLVSVRSGAARSMPGMMDTVLNLGLNTRTVEGLIQKTGNARFAWDAYRRFINMFGDVVMGIPHERFEHAMEAAKHHKGLDSDAPDTKLDADDLEQLVTAYKTVYREATKEEFPEDPRDQLRKAINAVFNSWNNDRAVRYRQLNRITGLIGTAVNVQAMVFGNMGETSGTGVAFTRDPSTGENRFYGEYLVNAQGEDVVAGIRTPEPIHRLEEEMPEAYAQLLEIRERLEQHYKDMQDVEFTVQEGTLYMLQTRSGQRTGLAAVRIACEMYDQGLIDEKTALRRVLPDQLNQLLHDIFEPKAKQKAIDDGRVIGTGLPASPGAASGKVVFTADEAEQWAARGEPVVLCRVETSPEDIGGMAVARGILTARGGMTSHAAVVARGMGRCCVAGCTGLQIEYGERRMHAGGRTIAQGEYISIDGTTGEVIEGQLNAHPSEIVQVLVHGTLKPEEAPVYHQFMRIMQWADQYRTLKIRTNADTPEDSRRARQFGAEGIGLCRTEHMFFEDERITPMREMILADDEPSRRAALSKLLPFQRDDFEGIFRAMDGLPVTIRLLDPPLHEFLPHQMEVQERIAEELGVPVGKIRDRVEQLHEMNPMLGLRGCRLGITYPEVYDMQVRAIIEAACACRKQGVGALPEIMIPLVGSATELSLLRERTERIAAAVINESGVELDYQVGTMIEVPRAALVAGEIAETAEFFSFGTNDLTQMTFGFSRDDVGPLVSRYTSGGVLPCDPFQTLDTRGVGQLVKMGVDLGRRARPELKVGICGEHGGDPDSVTFCHEVGMNYVSCSPFRVPIARLAAAQAALADQE